MNKLLLLPVLVLAGAGTWTARAAEPQTTQPEKSHEMVVNTSKRTATVQPTMYGIFFEDINYAADGGLYAELVKNRSFEFPDHYMGWNIFGNVELHDDGPFERNPHYVRLGSSGHNYKYTGLENEGFFGIGYAANAEYRFTVWARVPEGGEATLTVMLCDPSTQSERQQFAETRLKIDSPEWKQYEAVLKADRTVDRGTLRLMLRGTTPVDLEHVSLFPVDTWRGHRNGMRKDLAQALADLHPGVFRFPGGCIVEGTDLGTRYQWKNSVGRSKIARSTKIAGTTPSRTAFSPTIFKATDWGSTNIFCWLRRSEPNRCRSSMSGLRANSKTRRGMRRSMNCNRISTMCWI